MRISFFHAAVLAAGIATGIAAVAAGSTDGVPGFGNPSFSSAAMEPLFRRAEANYNNYADYYEDLSFLGGYDLKLIGCQREMVPGYSAVLLRLCPAETGSKGNNNINQMGCDSSHTEGCSSVYGDILVELSTFVGSYLEEQQQQQQQNGNGNEYALQMEDYAGCREYQPEGEEWENYQFFVGPRCSRDGLDIALGLFRDENCTKISTIPFETISNGWTLPYADGGLVSTACMPCTDDDNDNNNDGVREVCKASYQAAEYRCEAGMASSSSSRNADVEGCEAIELFFPGGPSAGTVAGRFFSFFFVLGFVGYGYWWYKTRYHPVEYPVSLL